MRNENWNENWGRSPNAAISSKHEYGCNVLHEDGMINGDYVEQFAYLLFGFGINSPLDTISPTAILYSRI